MTITPYRLLRALRAFAVLPLAAVSLLGALPAIAADTLNVYSIWPENWARPMFEEFEEAAHRALFRPYKPPSFAVLPARFKQPDGQWIAIADDPLVFMSNDKFIKENGLKAPASSRAATAPSLPPKSTR